MKNWIQIVDLLAKIALPLAIAYFGWTQYKMTANFNENKLDKELMLKFIDISWASLNSNDTIEMRNAIRLLGTIDPKYSVQLLEVLSLDTSRTKFMQREIKSLSSNVQESIIEDMKIDIYYSANELEAISNEIKSRLMTETKLDYNDIKEFGKRRIESINCSNEIIYAKDSDYQKVRALQSFLNSIMKNRTFKIRKQVSLKKGKILINLCV